MFPSSAPLPRFRIYTSPRSYLNFLRDWRGGAAGDGAGVAEFEARLCEHLKVGHAVCVPQNRVGVYLTVKALIKPGQQVIMSPYTIADITNMVILAGGRPLFADVERETCNIAYDEVERLMNPDVGLVLITHLHGLAAEAERIRQLCEAHGVPMIEDAAQAFGTRADGMHAGTIGTAGVFSFGMYKNINSWLGGAIVTRDGALAARLRNELAEFTASTAPMLWAKLRSGLMTDVATWPPLFKAFTFWVFRYGYINDVDWINHKVLIELDMQRKNALPDWYRSRYTDAQARLALSQLATVDSFSRARIERGLRYHAGLRDIPELIIPPARDDGSHTYTYFPIQYPRRTELLKFMMRHYRDVAAQHYKNNADIDSFSDFYRDCPAARAVAGELIFLPTYPRYGLDQVDSNIRVIRQYFGRA